MISDIFRAGTRTQEYISRWGGEEFLLLLPETPGDGAMIVAERLRSKVSLEKIVLGREELAVTMSFGVGEYNPSISIEENIDRVDKEMYKAKRSGKNCVKFVQQDGEQQ
jgi:diguanylate cyclase (GGDEF)-like protein